MSWHIDLPTVIAGMLFIALNVYVLMGGADLGGGVWDLLASGPRRMAQRELIAGAIGPIWEANHVWLVIVVVICFTAFPPVFAEISTVLHIPLTLMLFGIVLRGSAFVFRSYAARAGHAGARWGHAFAVASTATPVLLGVVIGAIATGNVTRAWQQVGSGSFSQVYLRSWADALPVTVGLLALALFAQLAAIYLAVAADDHALREDFRQRALAATAVAAVVAVIAAIEARRAFAGAPLDLLAGGRASAWVAITAATVIATAICLRRGWLSIARVTAVAGVSMILWGWALSQYPYLVPPSTTIDAAAAPRSALLALLWALLIGGALLVPSLWFLLRTFTTHGAQPSTSSP